MSLFAELKRRNVIRVGAAYAVVGWVLLQAADILFGNFGAPAWVFRSFAVLLFLGWPLALFLAWAYELTPEGIKRTRDVPLVESGTGQAGRKLDFVVIGVLALALGWFAWDKFTRVPAPPPVETAVEHAASIAVLPFVNMSPDPEQEYFSDGLSEEILNLLAQGREFRVIGRTSSFAFKGRAVDLREIGATLNVSHLLEGSVRRAGDQLRITAQLIEVEGGTHLWARTFDRRLENVFEIQSEIAGAIAESLRVSLIGETQAAPVVQVAAVPAFERFLQARRLIQGRTLEGIEAARGLLDEALALDPDYAPAHALAAQAMLLLAATPATYGDIPLDEAAAAAQALIDRALALDPRLAEAHAVQGLLHTLQQDLTRAEAALARALEINPSLSDALNWQAGSFLVAGRLREMLAAQRRLAEIDPLNLANLANLSLVLAWGAQYEEAEAVALRIQRGFPDSAFGFDRLANVLGSTGRLADAHAPAERALALAPDSRFVQAQVGYVFFALGDFDRVLALPGSHQHGTALIALGRVEEAVAAARAQAAAREDFLVAYALMRTLSLAGRHDEVLAEYEKRWGDLTALEAFFGINLQTGEITPIAAAQRALGRDEALAETLQRWGARLEFMREQGFADSGFRAVEASRLALAGQGAGALAALTEAIDQGWREPLLGIDPSFAELREDPRFQAQVERMTGLIDVERAKLGWGLLP